MEKNIAKLCNAVEKNTLVFFPSYNMMSKMRPFLERDIKKNMYWEESRQQKKTMLALSRFRNGRDGVFFTVMGGSIAEGIDFPGDELCFAIIVGIPYPPPTMEIKAMSQMFDKKYGLGTGWKYTSEVPALRKIKQAIGRLIRTETDRGMAVIFDSRISKYAIQLDANLSTDPLKDVTEFFEHPNH
jgi:DNA excision repair protein ERCC-2